MDSIHDVDCEWNCQTHSPPTYIFKTEAALTPEQSIVAETLTISPHVAVMRHTDALGTRTLRLNALPGLGGRWILFDPTRMLPSGGNVIRIGCGLDAADLPFATIFGSAQMTRMSPLVFAHAQDRRLAA